MRSYLVLDSYSTDNTLDIAKSYGCVIHQHEFVGYGDGLLPGNAPPHPRLQNKELNQPV